MARVLKIWNGRSGCCYKPSDSAWAGIQPYRGAHVYAAAFSRADLRRLIVEYCGRDPGVTELRDYWNCGSWGIHMEGITAERGIWLRKDEPGAKPVRLI